MQITVLGSCGPYPKAGGACSGYLLEDGNHKVLIDCGNGVLSRLLQKIDSLEELDVIILTHLHSDHISDALVLRYALGINKMKGSITKSVPLYAPLTPQDKYNEIQFMNAFKMNGLNANTIINVGEMKITFESMLHPVETYGVIVEKENKKFVYSSDTKYCDNIIRIANEADLFICECNLLNEELSEEVYHLTTGQVGEIASMTNVKKLLLTHIYPEYDTNRVLEEVKEKFSGEVEIAEEMETYHL